MSTVRPVLRRWRDRLNCSSKTKYYSCFLSKNPFKCFTVDSEKMRQLSPIFELMCFGRDFENGRELAREIVDEKSDDISTFLRCLYDHDQINGLHNA